MGELYIIIAVITFFFYIQERVFSRINYCGILACGCSVGGHYDNCYGYCYSKLEVHFKK
jgi:hypothetical protein